MSDKSNKSKPMAERLARIVGSTTFRDAFTSQSMQAITFHNLLAALGFIMRGLKNKNDEDYYLYVAAFETHYASTTMHEDVLKRAYARKVKAKNPKTNEIVDRWAGLLAVRKLAGQKVTRTDLVAYAWLCRIDKVTLEQNIRKAESWLDELKSAAELRFKKQFEA